MALFWPRPLTGMVAASSRRSMPGHCATACGLPQEAQKCGIGAHMHALRTWVLQPCSPLHAGGCARSRVKAPKSDYQRAVFDARGLRIHPLVGVGYSKRIAARHWFAGDLQTAVCAGRHLGAPQVHASELLEVPLLLPKIDAHSVVGRLLSPCARHPFSTAAEQDADRRWASSHDTQLSVRQVDHVDHGARGLSQRGVGAGTCVEPVP